ncbi:hypothetical protein LCGC14_2856930 [marine sediment metagenome]|uniref:Uncharacterized protein n=1 Tax=marine sediment metagenome TaxID=412755 RepID=A0A0F8Y6Z5_9ZZZZ
MEDLDKLRSLTLRFLIGKMKGLSNNRKGQSNISSIGAIAIAILVAVVILGLGATILDKIQGAQTDSSTTIADNQSFTWPGNNTLTGFDRARVQTGSVVVYCNATKLGLGINYSVESSGVKVYNDTVTDGSPFEQCLYNMTFAYNYGSSAYNSSGFGLAGVSTFAEFIPSVAIVAMAAIVIGILLVFFGRTKGKEE